MMKKKILDLDLLNWNTLVKYILVYTNILFPVYYFSTKIVFVSKFYGKQRIKN